MKNEEILAKICKEIEMLRKKELADFAPEEFKANGGIIYMNSNDGTELDFFINHRTCEFGIIYADSNYYAIKAYVVNDGYLCAYVFDDGPIMSYSPSVVYKHRLCSEKHAEEFARWLAAEYDDKKKYDTIVFPVEVSK